MPSCSDKVVLAVRKTERERWSSTDEWRHPKVASSILARGMLLMGRSHLVRTGLHSELAPRVFELFFGDDHGLWPEGLRSRLLRSHGGVHARGRVSSGGADGCAAAAQTEPETPPGAPRPGASHAPNRVDLAAPSIDRPRDRASQDLKLLLLFLASHLASKKMEKLNFSAVTPAQAFQKCRAQKQRRVLEEEGEDQASRWRGAFGLWGREAGPWRPPRPQADPPDPRPVLR